MLLIHGNDNKYILITATLSTPIIIKMAFSTKRFSPKICTHYNMISVLTCVFLSPFNLIQLSTSVGFLLDSMFDFAERFNQLALSEEELALFSAIVLFAPGTQLYFCSHLFCKYMYLLHMQISFSMLLTATDQYFSILGL